MLPPPLIGGGDLIAMGRKPGPAFKRWLEAVREEQLEGRLKSREEALAWIEAHPGGADAL